MSPASRNDDLTKSFAEWYYIDSKESAVADFTKQKPGSKRATAKEGGPMKFITYSVFFFFIAISLAIVRQQASTYTVDLGIEYRVVDFVSEKHPILDWPEGGHRTDDKIESLTVLTNGQPVSLQATMRDGLFGLWPAKVVRFVAQPATL